LKPAPVFLALMGPTASGKTALSLDVARALGCEIVSVDSRQVYRGMDLGTAKATPAERAAVPHYGLDVVAPDEAYSAGRFARDARRWIAGIRSRGAVPLLVGGTGFFLRALTDPVFREPSLEPRRLHALRAYLSGLPRSTLEGWVRVLDPARAVLAAEGGPQRLTRTLEVALLTGRPLSWWHREAPAEAEPVEGLVVVLELPREELDRRIAARVDDMFAGGLTEEVAGLVAAGYGPEDPGMTGVGYREVLRHLSGEWSVEDAAEAVKAATRRYARRQLTWLRNQLAEDGVLRLDAQRPRGELCRVISQAWEAAAAGRAYGTEVGTGADTDEGGTG
jgi:tRNA dimethylallyltransferase